LRFGISGRGRRLEREREREREKGRKEDGSSKSRQGVETAVPEAILHFLIACL
jgi:hypothetical protein